MATPHIESKKEEIAKVVLMPGDPLRAKKVAEEYLENPILVNDVRNTFAYTGTYKGREITVFSSGMGNPSMGIYSYELFQFYDVEAIIRIGSAGSYVPNLNVYDLLMVEESYSDSSYAKVQRGEEKNTFSASKEINAVIEQKAHEFQFPLQTGKVYCSDVFYKEKEDFQEFSKKTGCVACEMETFALFSNAELLGKKAGCILTISDSFVTKEVTTSEERQNSFDQMIHLALETAVSFAEEKK